MVNAKEWQRESFTEQVYIGVSSFVDEDAMNFLVYDWRTPIASLYYDYPPGAAAYETPGGRVTGTMLLKRQYRIRDGQLRHLFDASVTIGDEMLQQCPQPRGGCADEEHRGDDPEGTKCHHPRR
ncbi:hypothetical protein [Cohnella thermotolerans]|uniref:hypothetical protein n=1 Tax=Cohnella thermotolerans TaxID=329858 RepID=UPI003084268B